MNTGLMEHERMNNTVISVPGGQFIPAESRDFLAVPAGVSTLQSNQTAGSTPLEDLEKHIA